MASMRIRQLLAVVVAGIAGTIANALAVAAFVNPKLISLALVPGRYAVAIAVALAIPLSLRLVRGRLAPWAALAVLTVLPSLLAKLVFGAGAPWHLVLSLNAVYGLAALAAYRLLADNRRLALLRA